MEILLLLFIISCLHLVYSLQLNDLSDASYQNHRSQQRKLYDQIIFGGTKYLPPLATTTTTTTPQSAIITKQFYTVSAPDDYDDEQRQTTKDVVFGQARTNYRIIFIKTPSNRVASKLKAVYAPQEEKTIIYVLQKKDKEFSPGDIETSVAPTKPSKPEVYFIKYKTNAEASAVQKEIQGRYDHLGGTSEYAEEVAPVKSVLGSVSEGYAYDKPKDNGLYNYKR